MAEVPGIEERMERLLRLVAEELRPCKSCGADLAFVRHHKTGKLSPYTMDGVNHFVNCPAAEEFRRRKAAANG